VNPTLDWLHDAEKHIRRTLDGLRPLLLETQGKISHQLKDDKSAVTEMDVLVEQKLQAALAELDPAIAFSGEETGANFEHRTHWLVDPIDGTEPFIRGLPFATNMVALIDNGEPILGIVNNFMTGDYFMAIKGQGATCNGHALRVSTRPVDRAFVCIGSTNPGDGPGFALLDMLRAELDINAVIKFAATGSEMVAVASGAIEARMTYKGRAKPWDFAPGALIVQEAGGRVANVGEDTYDYRNPSVLAANPAVFDALNNFMKKQIAASRGSS
jgi:myo-inositol-1(or 4)-monophosphatase